VDVGYNPFAFAYDWAFTVASSPQRSSLGTPFFSILSYCVDLLSDWPSVLGQSGLHESEAARVRTGGCDVGIVYSNLFGVDL